jgi:hypothetical protein
MPTMTVRVAVSVSVSVLCLPVLSACVFVCVCVCVRVCACVCVLIGMISVPEMKYLLSNFGVVFSEADVVSMFETIGGVAADDVTGQVVLSPVR